MPTIGIYGAGLVGEQNVLISFISTYRCDLAASFAFFETNELSEKIPFNFLFA